MKFNINDLKPTLQKWSNKLGNRARSFAPSHIVRYKMIHSHLEFKSKDEFSITLYTDPPGGDAGDEGGKRGGDIFGREFGAGLYGEEKSTYEIRPRNKKKLAFFWEVANPELLKGKKFFGYSQTDERLLFNFVNHPGYEAANNGKGFLGLAFEQVAKEIDEDDEMSRKMTEMITNAIDGGIIEMAEAKGLVVTIR